VGARPSPLRGVWSRSFRALAALAYHRATRITTLSDANRARQIAAGAPASKISIIANGVDVPEPEVSAEEPVGDELAARAARERRPLRVGFVGRVVPIKDVITFIRACHQALQRVQLDVRIIGPCAEDSGYVVRCKDLVESLGVGSAIKFVGPMPPAIIYRDLDVVVLTSFSEGQPLVMLEAYAASLPVIATDVGACREMIEGRSDPDRRLGPSGLVTRVGMPAETAEALVKLAGDPALRRRMGAAGRQRVLGYYRRSSMLQSYGDIYRNVVTP
jgi:glycosyltransferase involved in cell wall biosynthesis